MYELETMSNFQVGGKFTDGHLGHYYPAFREGEDCSIHSR